MQRRLGGLPVAAALVVAQALAVYPRAGAAVFWLAVDLTLLALAIRGRRWALTLLAADTAFGALLFITAGASQVGRDPRFLLRGLAFLTAALPLVRAWRAQRVVV